MISDYQNRPRIHCPDGFSVSVQASRAHYCSPKIDAWPLGQYSSFELGYPEQNGEGVDLEGEKSTRDGASQVYGYVPKERLLELLQLHGVNSIPDLIPERLPWLPKGPDDDYSV